MNGMERMKASQKIIAEEDLTPYFEKLVEQQDRLSQKQKQLSSLQTRIDDLKAQNEIIEEEVEQYKVWQQTIASIKLHEIKLVQLELSIATEIRGDAQFKIGQLKEQLRQNQENIKPNKQKIEALKVKLSSLDRKQLEIEKAFTNDTSKARRVEEQFGDLQSKVSECEELLRNLNDERDQEEIEQLKNAIEQLKMKAPTPQLIEQQETNKNDLANQLKEIKKKAYENNNEMLKFEEKHAQLKREERMLTTQLRQLRNIQNQKLNLIRKVHPDSYKVFDYVSQHPGQFAGDIHFVPLVVNGKDAFAGRLLENCVQKNELYAFLAAEQSDVKRLIEYANKNKLRVIISLLEDEEEQGKVLPLEEIQKYGANGYLSDMLDGPPSVLHYLNAVSQMHNTVVTFNTSMKGKELWNRSQKRIFRVCTKDQIQMFKQSKYDSGSFGQSSITFKLKKAMVFTGMDLESMKQKKVDLDKIQQDLRVVRENSKELRNVQSDLSRDEIILRNKIKEIDRTLNGYRNISREIVRKEKDLEMLLTQRNVEQQEKAYKARLSKFNAKQLKMAENIAPLVTGLLQRTHTLDVMPIKRIQLKNDIQAIEKDSRNVEKDIQQIKHRLSHAETTFNEQKINVQGLERSLKRFVKAYVDFMESVHSIHGDNMSDDPEDEYETLCQNLTNDISEIKQKIEELKVKASRIVQSHHVMELFTRQELEIKNRESEARELQDELSGISESISMVLQAW
eukprot:CAMPEP_0117425890 /NCGR_PEP_ID=MMETSP0758-20121206/6105_1 /TAXON_ID=63605 /ORGANISM="Percolomonas cosmopolitus, Strain AE-1 (ATCC 50343)" /LENGTH=733 /DNA_ID=CAMNT_0005210713 /DNA_START=725 /DNA_END=2923 /DNA_ORIENTATION=-